MHSQSFKYAHKTATNTVSISNAQTWLHNAYGILSYYIGMAFAVCITCPYYIWMQHEVQKTPPKAMIIIPTLTLVLFPNVTTARISIKGDWSWQDAAVYVPTSRAIYKSNTINCMLISVYVHNTQYTMHIMLYIYILTYYKGICRSVMTKR
jgi:hypothetical protein